MKCSNPIIWRKYIRGILRNDSPLIIGSGKDDNADIQCLRDWNGDVLLPGTAFAGVLRNWLTERQENTNFVDKVFGEQKDNGRQSLLVFHDSYLKKQDEREQNNRITIRDGVALGKETKTAEDGKKYDYEIIEPGQEFDFRVEIAVRKNDIEGKDPDRKNFISDVENLMDKMFNDMASGHVRMGAKTSRGFGKIVLSNPEFVTFDFREKDRRVSEGNRWLDFDWSDSYFKPLAVIISNEPTAGPKFIHICADFAISGGILIRSYSTDPKAADAVHLTSNGYPVIPGTSWAGVLVHAIYNLGRALDRNEEMKSLTRCLFGEVREEGKLKGKGAFASNILIDESIINEGKDLQYTRNKIDRFTGGVVSAALFTERPHYGGNVHFECRIRRIFHKKAAVDNSEFSPEACSGAVLLALVDIGNGIQPVGGASSVGRGIMKLNSLQLNGKGVLENRGAEAFLDKEHTAKYLEATAAYLERGGRQ